ncbi:MAG TPA: class I adenylate-forming enzyme family protein [Pseudomonadales bacterium]|nr:class I adenylate-forming enzyme family protein [Pseudomonadales bacterium]
MTLTEMPLYIAGHSVLMRQNVAGTMSRQEALEQLTAPGQDYELETVKVFGRPCRSFKNGPQTLRDLFVESPSDETFLVFEDERFTFSEVFQRASQIASILIETYGIEKGDRVAISMRNYPEWVMVFMAVTSIGGIAVAMNALWTSEEMEFGLSDSGSRILFADQERIDRVKGQYRSLGVAVIAVRPSKELPDDVRALSDLLGKKAAVELPEVDLSLDDDATIFYTSGSTGHPKGAVSCHRNIVSALKSWELDDRSAMLAKNIEPPESEFQPATLLAVPLFHATGSHAVMLASFRAQRKLVSMYKWNAEIAAELIEQERISSFTAPAAMTGDLVETAKRTNCDLSSLASVGGGGAPRAPQQVRNIAAVFEKAMPGTGWGMTETNAIGTGIGGEDYLARPGSSGRCSAVLELRVLDEDGNELPAGERGELQVRGTSVIRGYWNRPEANAETFMDGWLRTGDVAYIDDEGFLYIVDRIKDLVIRGGENIGCAEVEAGLLAHDQVLEASVYAVPDDRLGEEVGATIFTDDVVDEEELRGFLVDHIAKFKIPKYFSVTDQPLLRIASGKIDKRRIREQAVKELVN